MGGCLSSTEPGGPDVVVGTGDSGTNNAPTISGAPATAIMIGNMYSFSPSTSDADGDTLTFSIQNLPRWATFDPSTGRVSGQALLGDEGVYDQIKIMVTDGSANTSLPNFSITVTSAALGSMTLSWTAPTLNTDGTPLMDLAGYKIYFGMSQGNYPNSIRIDNPSISTYLVENLLPDTYYVVATSFNALGIESTYSNVAVKSVASD